MTYPHKAFNSSENSRHMMRPALCRVSWSTRIYTDDNTGRSPFYRHPHFYTLHTTI